MYVYISFVLCVFLQTSLTEFCVDSILMFVEWEQFLAFYSEMHGIQLDDFDTLAADERMEKDVIQDIRVLLKTLFT